MVTIINIRRSDSGNADYEFKGLSTDPKPTPEEINLGENSLFLELDTAILYYFTGGAWTALGGSGDDGE